MTLAEHKGTVGWRRTRWISRSSTGADASLTHRGANDAPIFQTLVCNVQTLDNAHRTVRYPHPFAFCERNSYLFHISFPHVVPILTCLLIDRLGYTYSPFFFFAGTVVISYPKMTIYDAQCMVYDHKFEHYSQWNKDCATSFPPSLHDSEHYMYSYPKH